MLKGRSEQSLKTKEKDGMSWEGNKVNENDWILFDSSHHWIMNFSRWKHVVESVQHCCKENSKRGVTSHYSAKLPDCFWSGNECKPLNQSWNASSSFWRQSACHAKEPQISQEEQPCSAHYFKVSFLTTSCKTRRIIICVRRITSSDFAVIQLFLLLIVDGLLRRLMMNWIVAVCCAMLMIVLCGCSAVFEGRPAKEPHGVYVSAHSQLTNVLS